MKTPARRRGGHAVFVTTAAVAIGVDFASKIWASLALAGQHIPIGPVTLHLIRNRGVAFSVGAHLPATALILLTASIAATVALAAWRGVFRPLFAAGLIVGGAIANLADRLIGGSVIDFIDIGRLPVFNLADVFIFAGVAVLMLRNENEPDSERPDTSR